MTNKAQSSLGKAGIFLFVFFFSLFTASLSAAEHTLFSKILKKYVHKDFVHYSKLKKSPLLAAYIKELALTNPEAMKGKKRRLAYWINAYNAYTLKLICDKYPVKSIKKLGSWTSTIWETWKFKIYGKEYTLDHIEHKIIRPKFREPRIHAALVCAAKSCPPLRTEAYEAAKLDKQLDSQMRRWLAKKTHNRFDPQKKRLYLSKIFSWFGRDFRPKGKDLLPLILPYFPSETQKQIRRVKREDLDIEYLDYDWSLNGS